MLQPRWHSWVETCCFTAIGFGISWFLNVVVLRAWGFPVSVYDSFWIACVFTIASLARGYLVRRWFNAWLRRMWMKPSGAGSKGVVIVRECE